MMTRLMNLKSLLQNDLEEEKVNTKVNQPLSIFQATKSVILFLGVLIERIRMKGRKESTKEEEIHDQDFKRNKDDKGKKSYYIAEEEINNVFESKDDEVV